MRGRLLLIFVIAVVVLQSVIGAPTKYSQQGGSVVERDTLFFEVQGDPPFTWWQVPAYPEGDFSYETTASNREKLTWTSPPINVQYIHFKIWVKDNSGGTYGFSPRTVYDYLYDRGFGHECLVIDTRSCSGITSAGNIELRANLFADEWVFGDVLTGISLSISGSATVGGGLTVTGSLRADADNILYTDGTANNNVILRKDSNYWYIAPWGTDTVNNMVVVGGGARTNFQVSGNASVREEVVIGSSGTKKIYAEGDDLVIDLG